MRILLTGGGTGGHIFPLIAVAEGLRKEAAVYGIEKLEIVFVGPKIASEIWRGLLRDQGIKVARVLSAKLRRYFSFLNFIDLFKLPLVLLSGLWQVFWHMPELVFSKGGYGSWPVVWAARFYRIPVFIHESDAKAGIVNKKLAKYAKKVFIGFEAAFQDFPPEKVVFSGNPLRSEILVGQENEARAFFHIFSKRPVVLFMGGSQGAKILNELVLNSLEELAKKFDVIHITGQEHFPLVAREASLRLGNYETQGYHPYPFLTKELALAYQLSDVVVSRASASSIYEIAAWAKPSILVPLEGAAQDHQRANAYEYAKFGGAIILEEENLTPHILVANLDKILVPEIWMVMAQAARSFLKTDAVKIITQAIFEEVKKV